MNLEAEQLLQKLIDNSGANIINEPRRMESLLKDYAQGQYKREVNLWILALREGIVQELKTNRLPFDIMVTRLVNKLSDEHGIDIKAAQWTVDSWAFALGLSINNNNVGTNQVKEEQKTSTVTEKAANDSDPNRIILELSDHSGRMVRFTDRVVVLPAILDIFSRPLWIANPTSNFRTSPWAPYYEWINHGEVVEQFNISLPGIHWLFEGKKIEIPLFSLVSGLYIHTRIDFNHDFFGSGALCTYVRVLLPEYEPIPADASEMFQMFCAVCRNHPEIFFKPKELRGRYTEQELADAIARQSKPPVRHMSMTKDFSDVLEELKRLRPILRK